MKRVLRAVANLFRRLWTPEVEAAVIESLTDVSPYVEHALIIVREVAEMAPDARNEVLRAIAFNRMRDILNDRVPDHLVNLALELAVAATKREKR
jgi:hypothetical protein